MIFHLREEDVIIPPNTRWEKCLEVKETVIKYCKLWYGRANVFSSTEYDEGCKLSS